MKNYWYILLQLQMIKSDRIKFSTKKEVYLYLNCISIKLKLKNQLRTVKPLIIN